MRLGYWVRRGKALLGASATMLAFGMLVASTAYATPLTSSGEGAGQTLSPLGLAIDQSIAEATSGYLYVADRGNNRVDVFDENGTFKFAFGWKVNASSPEEKLQVCTAETGCLKGTAGSGDGQFNQLRSVAVDSSTHEIYVGDFGNQRVQKFDSAGGFLLKFGIGEAGEKFESKMVVAVGPGGVVHVADNPTLSICLRKYEPSGGPPILTKKCPVGAAGDLLGGLAVDSVGNIYIRGFPNPSGDSFTKYDPSVNPVFTFPDQGGVTSLAVDADDHLFGNGLDNVGTSEYRAIIEYDTTNGNVLRRFAHRPPTGFSEGLAAYTSTSGGIIDGDIYVSEGEIVHRFAIPEPGPLIVGACKNITPKKTRVTLSADVNPEGKETTYHFEYLTQEAFEDNGSKFEDATRVPANPVDDPKLSADPELHAASLLIEGLAPETEYRCRIVVSNADKANVIGEEGTFETGPPYDIRSISTSDVGTGSATLQARVNPLGNPVKGRFQYIDQASFDISGFAGPNLKETADIIFGAGEYPFTASAKITGLEPGASYQYRLSAELENGTFPRTSEPFGFRTFPLPPEETPDERGYEIVSPPQKNNAEVAVPTNAGGGSAIQATAPDGGTVTFGSFTAFADPVSAPAISQYLARRTSAGWSTKSINLFGRLGFSGASYYGFTEDLRFAGTSTLEPPLTADCPAGFTNLYWRNNLTEELRCVTNEVPSVAPGEKFCASYAGASADGSQVFFAAKARYPSADAPNGKGFNLYQWSEAEGLSLISRLPGGAESPAAPALQTGYGPGLAESDVDSCKLAGILHNAISADAQRVFWTYFPVGEPTRLLARLGGTKTVQLDKTQGGAGPAGGGRFWGASSDGSEVFFTTSNQLVLGASGGTDLYRYDFDEPEGQRLTDLTPDSLTPESEAAGVRGLLGSSENGEWAYFAANGDLAPGAASGNCATASGACSLYLWHEGEGVRFLARLSGADESSWDDHPAGHTARVAPDGSHLAFTSIADLVGYDNTDESSPGAVCGEQEEVQEQVGEELKVKTVLGACDAQVYLYDAVADALSCASCNPTGQRPIGPSSLPGWRNLAEGPRYLSDDGSRLFFQSRDRLVLADENKTQDVYEFERPGSGNCDPQSSAFLAASGGCLYLLTEGKNPDPSYLIDASAEGRDVFLSTRRELLPEWDQDERYDVYDFRVGGGFPDPPTLPPCPDLDACRPPEPLPPGFASPATETFEEDEAKPKRRSCPKGKRRVTRKGKSRCVKRQPKRSRRHSSPGRRQQQ